MSQEPYYSTYLKLELAERRERNPKYSLRSFARALDVSPGTLSRVMTGKTALSIASAQEIVSRLVLSPKQRALFLDSVLTERREQALPPPIRLKEPPQKSTALVDNALFEVIGNWYHSAILEMTNLKNFAADSIEIGRKLGIEAGVAKRAVDRLVQVGLLRWEGKRLIKTNASTTTKDKGRTSFALRQHTRQMFRKAIRSFEEVPIERRSSTGMTFAIDPDRLPLARRLIEDFTQELVRTLETGNNKEVYHLAVALFPLQKEAH